jgi:hypothetical protein
MWNDSGVYSLTPAAGEVSRVLHVSRERRGGSGRLDYDRYLATRLHRAKSLVKQLRAPRRKQIREMAAAVLARSRFVALNVAACGVLVRVIVTERLWRVPSPKRLAGMINRHDTDI